MGFLPKKKRRNVGLDIGSSLIKVVDLETGGKGAMLHNYGIGALPPDVIVDGEVMDREVVVDTIKGLFASKGITKTAVATALSGRGVIVKKITMEKMREAEAREQIRWEAEQHVPFDISDVSLDFQIVDTESAPDQMDVLLVAAKRENVTARVNLLQEAGLDTVLVDVAAFAIQNVYEANYGFEPGQLIALVNVGAETSGINFVKDGISFFTRDLSTAGGDCSQRLQKELGVGYEQATEILKGESLEAVGMDQLQPILRSFGEDLAVGIERTLPYLPSSDETRKMNRIVMSGGGAMIPGLADFLQERFEIPVEIIDPFQRIEYAPDLFGPQGPKSTGPIIAQAIGLAMRE
ncbi:hypothetical protein AMJ39_02840 [candidate division TA06 bacterium DG_24]|uniref:SHS2 domain-containing protein n=3 Tax=Bacteria division TA06 TaxID=1156500 RepID=A0A0S8JJ02_UNCT6|nr:MAG: hypothetical protein AMJ39_02840 [candidate division TA06 bacterium DG_24]KPK68404.1 MAG: hypothetical protein AMJ82_08295 [candidate division TA06 bacterium SM23_40]KPL08606.1 MAG: hypothetical protein AMJ71_07970 [candidate division TA06 bacterium SM1_40]